MADGVVVVESGICDGDGLDPCQEATDARASAGAGVVVWRGAFVQVACFGGVWREA